MGLYHRNEVKIGFGYVVDILLPKEMNFMHIFPDLLADKNIDLLKGLGIEIDGRSHYENYLGRPFGPTLLKRRFRDVDTYS
jgi:hypothetical protein